MPVPLVLVGSNTFSGGTNVEAGMILAIKTAVADGTSLTVGNAGFFAPVVKNLAANGLAVAPVPEAGTLNTLPPFAVRPFITACASGGRSNSLHIQSGSRARRP